MTLARAICSKTTICGVIANHVTTRLHDHCVEDSVGRALPVRCPVSAAAVEHQPSHSVSQSRGPPGAVCAPGPARLRGWAPPLTEAGAVRPTSQGMALGPSQQALATGLTFCESF